MDKPMPGWAFNAMSFMFRIRDLLEPRSRILQEVDLKPGFRVLDYGCGPGAYVPQVAERIGETGRVYALDLHPLAVQRVQALARKRQLRNVETIQSDCATGLPDGSVDVVLLYDIFHMLSEPDAILGEVHRVLARGGTLSVHDPHMREEELVSGVIEIDIGVQFEQALFHELHHCCGDKQLGNGPDAHDRVVWIDRGAFCTVRIPIPF